jgi:hypothetical protein
MRFVPANLSQLTWLESFTWGASPPPIETNVQPAWFGGEDQEHTTSLLAALPQLTRLTYLALGSTPRFDSPPRELAGLSRLRTFVWLDPSSPPEDAALPGGPWLGRLQRLAAPAHLLANSLPLLGAAPRLEHLVVAVVGQHGELTLCILRSAVCWPSLRQLSLGIPRHVNQCSLPAVLFPAALEAQHRRPSLSIALCDNCVIDSGLWSDIS